MITLLVAVQIFTLCYVLSAAGCSAAGIEPGRSVDGARANFTGLVLGCIEADVSKKILNTHLNSYLVRKED